MEKLMEKVNKLWNTFINLYSKTSISNHLIVSLLILLAFNFLIVSIKMNFSMLFLPITIIFLLSFIRNNYKLYDISINNNGEITNYVRVRFKFDKKKEKLTIFSGEQVVVIGQGNYEIKENNEKI